MSVIKESEQRHLPFQRTSIWVTFLTLVKAGPSVQTLKYRSPQAAKPNLSTPATVYQVHHLLFSSLPWPICPPLPASPQQPTTLLATRALPHNKTLRPQVLCPQISVLVHLLTVKLILVLKVIPVFINMKAQSLGDDQSYHIFTILVEGTIRNIQQILQQRA